MALKYDEDQSLKTKDLIFILAIAGRIDAQSRIAAKTLDQDRHVYYAYAALDSLSSSYSMFKYFFDVLSANNDADSMHEFMMTPGGMVAIASESIFLVAFSMLACRFENEKKDALKQFITAAWPYVRDVMKGLKNAYKGWRSAIQALNLVAGVDLKQLIVPMGLVLGLIAAANRFWLRSMVEKRKVMMGDNAALLLEIKKLNSLTQDERIAYLDRIQYQSMLSRRTAFVAAATGGLIDGLYLYVGVLTLASLNPPILAVMAVLCAIYTLACIITRAFEEYDFQLRLLITQTKCKLALTTKEIETSYNRLLLLEAQDKQPEPSAETIKELKNFADLIKQFERDRLLLKKQTTRTYLSAGLSGIKNGLYAYSALTSILFLVGTLITLSSVPFPPVLLIACVSLGIVFIVGFLIYSLRTTHLHLNKQNGVAGRPFDQLIKMKDSISNAVYNENARLDAETFTASLRDGLCIDPSPQFFFQEWFEVIRSFFSGIGKGQKFVDFAGNPLQEIDELGHYHDTPVMHALAIFSAAIFSITLALRALARGLGRPPLGQVDLAPAIEPVVINSLVEEDYKDDENEEEEEEEEEEEAPRLLESETVAPSVTSPVNSRYAFFSDAPHSRSTQNLDKLTPEEEQINTILDLK